MLTRALSISLLGPLRVALDGTPISEFRYQKTRALLAYLAMEAAMPHTRAELCTLLWPELTECAARRNLTQVLTALRHALGDSETNALLLAAPETVQLNPEAVLEVDARQFEALLDACDQHVHRGWLTCSACAERLSEALALYRGDFLSQLSVSNSAGFDEWALLWRERLRQRASSTLERLAGRAEWCGDFGQAADYARRLVELDPLREASQRALLRLLALNGQHAAAEAQYEQTQRMLADELATEPEAATRDLYAQLRAGQSEAWRPHAAPPVNGPQPPNALIGRDDDLQAVCAQLQAEDIRALTITGAPGIGKTRLALAAAHALRFDFENGAHFVDLAPAAEARLVIPAIAQALAVKEKAGRPLAETLTAWLKPQHALLVLDNFEHVLEAAAPVAELLAACPEVKALVTSRAALRVRAEHVHLLAPLETAEAVHLFTERAREARPDLVLMEDDADAIAVLCRRLDNLPLAIELVASRVRSNSPAELLQQLGSRLDAQATAARDAPDRQSSLRCAIAWSYDRLSADEQRLFAHLGVFLGGCTAAAVQAVAGEGLPVPRLLEALVDASLVQAQTSNDETRFMLLETLREFALEQLTARGETDEARQRHAAFFVRLAEAARPKLAAPEARQWMERLDRELDNVRAAVRWLRLHAAGEALQLISHLARYWQVRGHMREAQAWLEALLDPQRAGDPGSPAPTLAERARGAHVAGNLSLRLHDYTKAQDWLEESGRLYAQLGDTLNVGRVKGSLGIVAQDQGRYAEAEQRFRESLDINLSVGDPWAIASQTNNLGEALRLQGRLEEARACFAESAAGYRQTGDLSSAASAMNNMATVVRQLGDYAEARRLCEESYAVFAGLGDKRRMAFARQSLAQAEQAQGEITLAGQHYREAARLFFEVELQAQTLTTLVRLGRLERERGAWPAERLVGLLGRMAAFIQASDISLEPEERSLYDEMLATKRGEMSAAAFEAAWQHGQTLTLAQAVALALAS